jgi:hypothetical protein
MLNNVGRKKQNKFIGVGNPTLLQPAYVPPKIGHDVNVFPIQNYKELQQEAFEARKIVGQLKRANLFTVKNNMSANLAYGDDTIILEDVNVKNSQGQSILTEIEKEAKIAKNNARFDYKKRFPDSYNFKKTHFFDRGLIFSEDPQQNNDMINDYLYGLHDEELEKQDHNDKIQHEVDILKRATKAFNKGKRMSDKDFANRLKETYKKYYKDKKKIMRSDLPTKAGDVGDMDEQQPEIGNIEYMSEQTPDKDNYVFDEGDLLVQQYLEMEKRRNQEAEDEERYKTGEDIKKISGDDDEEEEGEGETTIATEGGQEIGTITFPFRFNNQTAITKFHEGMKCIQNSTDPLETKKRYYKFIVNLLKNRIIYDENKYKTETEGSTAFSTAEKNLRKGNYFLDTVYNTLDILNDDIKKEKEKSVTIPRKKAAKGSQA